MNRRQRKKKHTGEFQELAFLVEARLAGAPDWPQLHAMLNEFVDVLIEGNGLVFGGGCGDAFSGWVSAARKYAPVGEEHRALVGAWLEKQSLLEGVTVGPLMDAWTDHG